MKPRAAPLSLALICGCLVASEADAGSYSLLTVGFGTSVGVTRTRGLPSIGASALVAPELSLRLKALRVFGLEFAMDPGRSAAALGSEPVYDSTFRFSGLLYVVPLEKFGIYLKAGIGGHSIDEIVQVTSARNSYHAGTGLDVHIGEHLAVGGEFLVLVPGVSSIERMREDGDVGFSELVSAENFRAALSVRWFL